MNKSETIWPHPLAFYAMWIELCTAWTAAWMWWLPQPSSPFASNHTAADGTAHATTAATPHATGTASVNGYTHPQAQLPARADAAAGLQSGQSRTEDTGEPVNGHAVPFIASGRAGPAQIASSDGEPGGNWPGSDADLEETGAAIRDPFPYEQAAGRRIMAASDGLSPEVVFDGVPSYAEDETSYSDLDVQTSVIIRALAAMVSGRGDSDGMRPPLDFETPAVMQEQISGASLSAAALNDLDVREAPPFQPDLDRFWGRER